MIYYHDTSQLCRKGLDDVLRTRFTTLAFIVSELFPLDVFRCNFVPALQLKYPLVYYLDTLSYVEQVLTMCRV